MKELICIGSNNLATFTEEGKLVPQCEIILILDEPAYKVEGDQLVPHREESQTRFTASTRTLRKLAAKLVHLADEAEAQLTGAGP